MTCDQVREQIADYLAGSLSQTAAEELDDHFAHCAACQQETGALAETWRMLGLLETGEPSPALRPRFYESLEAYRQGLASAPPPPSISMGRRPFSDWGARGWGGPVFQLACAAALLIVGIVVGQWLSLRDRGQGDLARLQDEVGFLLAVLSRREEAIQSFQQALDLDAKFARAQYHLGAAYWLEKNPGLSIPHQQSAAAL